MLVADVDRGPKGELPQGSDGSYGTSVSWHKAMDPAGDVILAYKHNGRLLTPDHGFPIRVIIPGYIGGRMVKWLEEISVVSSESDNHYHYHDNRVLPSHVTEELAKTEGELHTLLAWALFDWGSWSAGPLRVAA